MSESVDDENLSGTDTGLPELVEFYEWLNSSKVNPLEDNEFEAKLWLVLQEFLKFKGVEGDINV